MRNKKLLFALLILLVLCMSVLGFWFWMQPDTPKKPVAKPRPVQAKQEEPKERRKETSAIAVSPITEFSPQTVYSGTLGEVTSIQAGRDINKVLFELKQSQVKVKEMEEKLNEKPSSLPVLSLPPIQQGTPAVSSPTAPSRLVVLSVKGSDTLSATLRSKAGTYIVRVGDSVPGFGKVQTISRDRVVVNNAALPWL